MLGVGRNESGRAARIGRHHAPVVAAGDDPRAVGRRAQDSAAVNCDAPLLAAFGDEDDRLFAQHEGRRIAEEGGSDHRRAGSDGVGALREGRGLGAKISHAAQPAKPVRIASSGNSRPMKTIRLSRRSSSRQGR